MNTVSITSKGQVTIPKAIRDALHLSTGDKINFIVNKDGEVLIKPVSKKAKDVFGLLAAKSKKKLSVEDMDNELKKFLEKESF